MQTVYIYLGVAALVGVLGGLTVRGVYGVLRKLLRLDARPVVPKGRTVKQYREEKRQQKLKDEPPALASTHTTRPLSPGSVSMSDSSRRGRRQKTLLNQIIHEEDDSEF